MPFHSLIGVRSAPAHLARFPRDGLRICSLQCHFSGARSPLPSLGATHACSTARSPSFSRTEKKSPSPIENDALFDSPVIVRSKFFADCSPSVVFSPSSPFLRPRHLSSALHRPSPVMRPSQGALLSFLGLAASVATIPTRRQVQTNQTSLGQPLVTLIKALLDRTANER